MQQSSARQTQSKLFVVLFLLAAFSFTLWTMSRIPHHVVLHVNEEWAIMLVGEKNINNLKFPARFKVYKTDTANVYFTGYGKFKWGENTITIRRALISLNGQSISKSRQEKIAHVTFYPDGRLMKGKLE
jgi:hypothetical protein